MEGMGLKFTPVMGDVSYAIQTCLGLWLALLGLITSPNSPNGGLARLRLPTHLLHLPLPLPLFHPTLLSIHFSPSCPPTSYNVPSVILRWF